MSVASIAHAALLKEIGTARRSVEDSQLWDVSGDTRVLRTDMTSFLESLGNPNFFVKDYQQCMK